MSSRTRYPRNGLIGWLCVLKWEGMRERDRANERRVNLLALAWIGGLIVMGLMVKLFDATGPLVWTLAAVPVIFGVLFIRAYLKLLRDADELLRQMQLEALAVGFGAALVIGMTVMYLLPPSELSGMATLLPMVLGYTIRIVLGARELAQDSSAADNGATAAGEARRKQ